MKSNKTSKQKEVVKGLFNEIVDGVTNIIDSGEYTKFLKFSKNFHSYSFNNRILIYLQMEDATHVAGFKTWESMNRKLKYGAKGIKIVYPIKRKYTTKIDGQETITEDGEKIKEEKTIEYMTYGYTYVYDISQTTGEPMPMETKFLNSNNKQEFLEFLKGYAPYPVLEKNLRPGLQGYWSETEKHIVLEKNLSIDDKLSVLLHELTHALYDDFNYAEDRNLSETFVESVAFIVADYFGLDTSKCSFNYITKWAHGDVKTILDLGNKIQKTADNFINRLQEEFENQNIRIAC